MIRNTNTLFRFRLFRSSSKGIAQYKKPKQQRRTLNQIFRGLCASSLFVLFAADVYADGNLTSKFSNSGSILNTRHNMTQNTIGAGASAMNPYRNDYGEVCVYCHTPHGASGAVDLPLWNRTINTSSYTTYDTLGTTSITSNIVQPGLNSLACLSCHDGTLAVDSVINMPGSDGYLSGQQTSQNDTFLNQWTNSSGADASVHLGLDGVNESTSCLACHSEDAGIVGAGATSFKAFAIGTDLTNDHPVGVELPLAAIGVDFNNPGGIRAGIRFFDGDGDNRPDKEEIRFYDTGNGPMVECASCHDPHGVSPTGNGGAMNPSFLRVSNANSAVCLTCHVR